MRTVVFDIETFGLSVDLGIPLCMCAVEYQYGQNLKRAKITTFRVDKYPEWTGEEGRRSQPVGFIKDVFSYLNEFDILVAHNGLKFDRPYLNTLAMKHGLGVDLARKKLIDPVWASRKHFRLSSNGLFKIIDYFDITDKKTPIHWSTWVKATIDGDKEAMDEIVHHCEQDIKALYQAYDLVRGLVLKVDNRGSIG